MKYNEQNMKNYENHESTMKNHENPVWGQRAGNLSSPTMQHHHQDTQRKETQHVHVVGRLRQAPQEPGQLGTRDTQRLPTK